MHRLLPLLVALALAGCATARPPSAGPLACEAPTTASPRLGERFDLRQGEGATIRSENLRLVFSALREDSRCAAGVHCVWEGNGRVEILATGPSGESQTLTLNTSPRFDTQASFSKYRVELLDLSPYPQAGRTIAAGGYCVGLIVEAR